MIPTSVRINAQSMTSTPANVRLCELIEEERRKSVSESRKLLGFPPATKEALEKLAKARLTREHAEAAGTTMTAEEGVIKGKAVYIIFFD
jgi:hypothetical protein